MPFSHESVSVKVDDTHFVGKYSKQLYVNTIKLSWPSDLFSDEKSLVWLPSTPVAVPTPTAAGDVPCVTMVLIAGDHVSLWDDKKNGIWCITCMTLHNNQRGGKSKNYISLNLAPTEIKDSWTEMYEAGKSFLPRENLTRPGATPDFGRRCVASPRNISMVWRCFGIESDTEMYVSVRAFVNTQINVLKTKEVVRRQKKKESDAPVAAAAAAPRKKRGLIGPDDPNFVDPATIFDGYNDPSQEKPASKLFSF